MDKANDYLINLLKENRKGKSKGIYSVCSANSDVLKACFQQAKKDGGILLIESTSNQVDQYGGYTGMKPADFVGYVNTLAEKVNFPADNILLGGDHLGPNPWKNLPAEKAMAEAKVLIEEYVKVGYLKIHLDTSMYCADDEGDRHKPMNDEVVAARTVELCGVAENAWEKYRKGMPKPVYIIGTEVPVPGGAQENEEEIKPTSPEDAALTIEITRNQFKRAGLSDAWERVIGTVVQPGVEFSDDRVFNYQRGNSERLSKKVLEFDNLVYEAHSTDYQTEENLKALVEDHFCILKVGPWLTFAYREALFALELMEIELIGGNSTGLSDLRATLDHVMLNEPVYWKKYYQGDLRQIAFKRKYSFSDRSRYYWPVKELEKAKNVLFNNLRNHKIPLSLLSQYMPAQFYKVCEGLLKTEPEQLVLDHIQIVSGKYSRACGLS